MHDKVKIFSDSGKSDPQDEPPEGVSQEVWQLMDDTGREVMRKTVGEAKERKAREEKRKKEESNKRDRSLSADDVSSDSY